MLHKSFFPEVSRPLWKQADGYWYFDLLHQLPYLLIFSGSFIKWLSLRCFLKLWHNNDVSCRQYLNVSLYTFASHHNARSWSMFNDFFVCGLKVSSSKYLFDNSYFVSTWRTGGVLPMVIRFAPPPPNHTHTRIHLLKKSTCGFMFVVHQSTYQNPNLES